MTTDDLVERLSRVTGFLRAQSRQVVDFLFQSVCAAAAHGEDISITGVGRFSVASAAVAPNGAWDKSVPVVVHFVPYWPWAVPATALVTRAETQMP